VSVRSGACSQRPARPSLLPRRRVLKAGTAAVGLAALGPFAGCSRAARGDAPIVFGATAEPNTLHPLLAPDLTSRQAIDLVLDGLVAADESTTLVPRLATNWTVSPDGRLWTFTLREGVKWHDGAPFSSADVVFTYDRLLDTASGATLPRSDYSMIDAIDAPDASTVRFRLKAPYAPLLSRLAVGIVPRHLVAGSGQLTPEFGRRPVGTGAYRLSEWAAAQQLSFEAKSAYYLGSPAIERIAWRVVPDSAALTLQLLGGEIHVASVPDPLDRERIRSEARLSLAEAAGGAVQISLQIRNPLFADQRVRRALALALDPAAMISGLMKGEATPAVSDIPPSSWAYDPDLRPLASDPSESRGLLAEAGWRPGADGILARNGRPFEFSLSTYAGERMPESVMLIAQQQWQAIGLKVSTFTQERNSFVAARILKGDFDAAVLQSSVQIDPDLTRRFHSRSIGQGQNFLSYSSQAVDDLLDRAAATADREIRRSAYREVQRILLADLPQIPLFHPTTAYAYSKTVTGVKPNVLGPFWNAGSWRMGS
jgi:peptide/nickel transport system substrate-binding protein